MLESRFAVNSVIVDAKTPEQAVRKSGALKVGAVVEVVEWTGKVTVFEVNAKGRLEKVISSSN